MNSDNNSVSFRQLQCCNTVFVVVLKFLQHHYNNVFIYCAKSVYSCGQMNHSEICSYQILLTIK